MRIVVDDLSGPQIAAFLTALRMKGETVAEHVGGTTLDRPYASGSYSVANDGTVAFTHLWWSANGPPEDPLASDPPALHLNRARVLEIAGLIVPGHGAPFKPSAETPR